MRITIDVTREDIQGGVPKHPGQCPVARACRRHLFVAVYVCAWELDLRDDDAHRAHEISLPDAARQFVQTFDRHGAGAVEPFQFTVDVPAWAVRVAAPEPALVGV